MHDRRFLSLRLPTLGLTLRLALTPAIYTYKQQVISAMLQHHNWYNAVQVPTLALLLYVSAMTGSNLCLGCK